jgi:hypothetical protein
VAGKKKDGKESQDQEQDKKKARPPQEQERQPGIEAEMTPRPRDEDPDYRAAGKLEGRVALITGGAVVGAATAASAVPRRSPSPPRGRTSPSST